jgi:hypothetical protein
VDLNRIRELTARVDEFEAEAKGPADDYKAEVKATCDALHLRKDAYQSARKLKKMLNSTGKKGGPVAVAAWLETFNACVEAFGLDGQLELVGAIAEAELDEQVKAKAGRRAARRKALEEGEPTGPLN